MRRFLEIIGSRRFAIFLLAATLAVILLSNLLPNLSAMKPEEIEAFSKARPLLFRIYAAMQVGNVVRSPLFLLIPLFIFASITVCTFRRVKREGLGWRRFPPGEGKYRASFDGSLASVEGYLRKKGWDVEAEGPTVINAFKGGRGFWGSVLFHIGINVVIIGIALSLMTRFNGRVVLTEGYGTEMKEAFLGDMPEGFPVRGAELERFEAVYAGGFPVDYSMDVTFWTEYGETRGRVKVNEPISVMGYQFSPTRHGFAPRFSMKKGEETLLDAYINLVVMTPEQVDTIDLPEEGIKIRAQFFPDLYMEGRTPKTRSRETKNPVFFVEVRRGKEMLGQGFLPLNKEVSFAGYTLEFKDLKMWAMFGVSKDLGVPAVAAGFMLIVVGLVVRFIWHEKTIRISTWEGFMEIGGRARYFPALFEEELKRLTEELKSDKG